jgi:hypothetical protein
MQQSIPNDNIEKKQSILNNKTNNRTFVSGQTKEQVGIYPPTDHCLITPILPSCEEN